MVVFLLWSILLSCWWRFPAGILNYLSPLKASCNRVTLPSLLTCSLQNLRVAYIISGWLFFGGGGGFSSEGSLLLYSMIICHSCLSIFAGVCVDLFQLLHSAVEGHVNFFIGVGAGGWGKGMSSVQPQDLWSKIRCVGYMKRGSTGGAIGCMRY